MTMPGTDDQSRPRLSIRGLTKAFGNVKALTDVSFDVMPGEVVGLLGDNGAGKSTLIKTLCGVHQPDAGSFTWEGSEVKVDSPRHAMAMLYIPDPPSGPLMQVVGSARPPTLLPAACSATPLAACSSS